MPHWISATPVTISSRDVRTQAAGGMRGFALFKQSVDQVNDLLTVIQGFCAMALATAYLKQAGRARTAGWVCSMMHACLVCWLSWRGSSWKAEREVNHTGTGKKNNNKTRMGSAYKFCGLSTA